MEKNARFGGKGENMAKEFSKETLREEFSKEPEKYYKVELFDKQGFVRKKCKICGRYFWTADADRDVCGDSAHTPYGFFKDKPQEISYVEFWKRFSDFFEKNGHAIVKRYPVVSRWRQDLYFTIAGIQDFQRIENGLMSFEYPANPLLVPQMCLRFNDIENVGITGRHFTSFMMANQTAFNWPQEGYWKDRTIELNFDFLTKVLEIRKEDIIYHEDVWAMPDFSEFGPSLESFSKGLEIVNNVFTEFELVNGQMKSLKNKVVDVGWGFERALWFYTGYDNAYEATFRKAIKEISKESNFEINKELYKKFASYAGTLDATEISNIKDKISAILSKTGISTSDYETQIKKAQAIYATIDHVRTLLFAITDGALPSNIGGGYNLRVILRRVLDFEKIYGIRPGLKEIAEMVAEDLKGIYPELKDSIDTFEKVVKIEEERYRRTNENAKKIIETLIAKKNKIERNELKTLYESNGITPDMIVAVAQNKNVSVELPDNPYLNIVTSDMVKKEREKGIEINTSNLPETIPLYYDFATNARAKVLYSEGKYVVLDKTPFYPEGGGQVADTGTINGFAVEDVQKVGKVIVHILKEPHKFEEGSFVEAQVDVKRRQRLIAHHTATHLISAAARLVLGKHAWQEGAKKEPEKAHIDIAHYDKLSEEEVEKIENQVNEWILNGIRVKAQIMKRSEAEGRFGFAIYQGHGVPASEMRIITITDLDNNLIDAEACGGLHAVGKEQMLGIVKIINTYRIHDGVDRIEFVAGPAALDMFRKEHKELQHIATALNAEIPNAESRLDELKKAKEAAEKLLKTNNEAMAQLLAESYKGKNEINETIDASKDFLISMANRIVLDNKKAVVILKNKKGEVICIAGPESGKKAIEVLKEKVKRFKGGGGDRFAEGMLV